MADKPPSKKALQAKFDGFLAKYDPPDVVKVWKIDDTGETLQMLKEARDILALAKFFVADKRIGIMTTPVIYSDNAQLRSMEFKGVKPGQQVRIAGTSFKGAAHGIYEDLLIFERVAGIAFRQPKNGGKVRTPILFIVTLTPPSIYYWTDSTEEPNCIRGLLAQLRIKKKVPWAAKKWEVPPTLECRFLDSPLRNVINSIFFLVTDTALPTVDEPSEMDIQEASTSTGERAQFQAKTTSDSSSLESADKCIWAAHQKDTLPEPVSVVQSPGLDCVWGRGASRHVKRDSDSDSDSSESSCSWPWLDSDIDYDDCVHMGSVATTEPTARREYTAQELKDIRRTEWLNSLNIKKWTAVGERITRSIPHNRGQMRRRVYKGKVTNRGMLHYKEYRKTNV